MQLDLFITGGSTSTSTPWKGDNLGSGFVRVATPSALFVETSTPLGNAGTFTGAAHAGPGSGMGSACFFVADVFADQAGTVFVERSVDGTATWQPCNGTAGTACAAGASVVVKVPVTAGNYRVRYTNGATPSTVFLITTAYSLN